MCCHPYVRRLDQLHNSRFQNTSSSSSSSPLDIYRAPIAGRTHASNSAHSRCRFRNFYEEFLRLRDRGNVRILPIAQNVVNNLQYNFREGLSHCQQTIRFWCWFAIRIRELLNGILPLLDRCNCEKFAGPASLANVCAVWVLLAVHVRHTNSSWIGALVAVW